MLMGCHHLQEGGQGTIKRHSFIRMSKLPDVRGISSHAKQDWRTYHQSHSAYAAYRKQESEWEKIYGAGSQRQDKESVLERLKNPQKEQQTASSKRQLRAKNVGRDSPSGFIIV